MRTTFGIWQHTMLGQTASGSRKMGQGLIVAGQKLVLTGMSLQAKGTAMIVAAETRIEASTLRIEDLRRRKLMSPLERDAAEIDDLVATLNRQADIVATAEATKDGASLRSIERLAAMRQEVLRRQERHTMMAEARESLVQEPDRSGHQVPAGDPPILDFVGSMGGDVAGAPA